MSAYSSQWIPRRIQKCHESDRKIPEHRKSISNTRRNILLPLISPFSISIVDTFLIVTTIFSFPAISSADSCYSCSGICFGEPCNCQMGSCQSSHCYIEKKPTETPGAMKITKGCIRHSPRLHAGCEYDNFADHVLCTCKGRFCNDIVALRRLHYRNVTCRMCTEKEGSDCDDTCTGQWCFEDSTTGASGCGFGPPSLPFFYKGYQLFYYTNKVCIILSRGAGKPRRHCICNTSMCNSPNSYFYSMPDTVERYSIKDPKYLRRAGHNSMRSLAMPSTEILALQTCYNCELNSQDASVTSSCKQNRCLGHFCTYVSQRTYASAQNRAGNLQSISERQGCMNVSDSTQVQLGCFRKWMHNEFEEVVCACKGDLCNRDDLSAFGFKTHSALSLLISLFAFFVLLNF